MEPNIQINQNTNPIVTPSALPINELPKWLKVIFRLYGAGQIFTAIAALIVPLLVGIIAGILGGGEEAFYEGYKLYAFFPVFAIPAFVIAYGFLKLKKWAISCLILELLSQLIALVFFKSDLVSETVTVMSSPVMLFLTILPIVILVLGLVYRDGLKGKYIAIIPIVLMIAGLGYGQFLSTQSLNVAEEIGREIEAEYPVVVDQNVNTAPIKNELRTAYGVEIKPSVDRSILDEDTIGLLRYTIETDKFITTREGCVEYASQSFRPNSSDSDKAYGHALVNACVYYLELMYKK